MGKNISEEQAEQIACFTSFQNMAKNDKLNMLKVLTVNDPKTGEVLFKYMRQGILSLVLSNKFSTSTDVQRRKK